MTGSVLCYYMVNKTLLTQAAFRATKWLMRPF